MFCELGMFDYIFRSEADFCTCEFSLRSDLSKNEAGSRVPALPRGQGWSQRKVGSESAAELCAALGVTRPGFWGQVNAQNDHRALLLTVKFKPLNFSANAVLF